MAATCSQGGDPLLSAVLEARDAEDGKFLLNDDGEPPMGWAAFDALAALVARNSTRPQLVGLFVRVTAEAIEPGHPAHDWVRDHHAGTEAWLTDAIRTGQEHGEIDPDAPVTAMVHTTIAVMDGLQQQWLLNPDRVSMVKGARGAHRGAARPVVDHRDGVVVTPRSAIRAVEPLRAHRRRNRATARAQPPPARHRAPIRFGVDSRPPRVGL